ncbi:AAA family ATPase [Pseudomonas mandelii]|jgi:energy-coupling factor transporter ATP-binding protein EcfA2|uniref:AAA family ATPase n=1 Tax=Pseudomonas TaxID=286 RepID=UPI0005B34E65|nr:MULTISPECIES: AAA family ATPase [unclassified Pseudomonas]OOL37119.1 hypothetical protein BOO94_14415 [Pseudomonas sp. FSL W5-0299]
MELLNEILEWSQGLEEWQRDALRRVFIDGNVSPAEVQKLIDLVKEKHGCGPQTDARPIPLNAGHLPAVAGSGSVRLLYLENMQNVNRFPQGRRLELMPDRLNILFGENGAGKSGFARVLKNICRARHRTAVLPNAFDGTKPRPIPSASMVFLEDGNPRQVEWVQGQDVDSALAKVAVYDSACGSDYLAKEGASEYQPYGLPQLNRFIAVQREIQAQIGRDRDAIRLDKTAFNDLLGNHEVGAIVAQLGSGSDGDRLKQLATVTEGEAQRLVDLNGILATMDPEPEAKRAEQLAQRLETSSITARAAQRYVTDAALDEVKNRHDRLLKAREAWSLAQQQLHHRKNGQEAELLTGTGNDAWKLLFEAAAKFSTEHAYVGHDHPYLGDDAKCVLCQTSLEQDTKARLRGFSEYIANEASRNVQSAAEFMDDTMKKIAEANFVPLDQITAQQLNEIDPVLALFAATSVCQWNARRDWAQQAVHTGIWDAPRPALPEGETLDVRLSGKVQQLRVRAQEFRKALDQEAKKQLEKERTELQARERLSGRIQEVLKYVGDAQAHKKLSDCYASLDSRGLSRKATAFATKHVTNALADSMNEELRALGFRGRVEALISGRTNADAGQTMVTLKLKDCENGAHLVLSEGEQRVMGLAIFLAESRLQGHASTIVFDDPTTSLDHHHRRSIANRLTQLAKERQLIIFTHDAVFLGDLGRTIIKAQQPAHYLTIGWDGKYPGHVKEGMTWETADWKARLDEVGGAAKEIQAEAGDYLSEALKNRTKDCYTKLRGTIERAVREVYMNETILPFSDEVSVNSYGAVFYQSQEEWEQLMDIYDRCCEATDAHDTNGEHQLPIPEPDQLIKDVESTTALVQFAKKAKGKFENERGQKRRAAKKVFVNTEA